MLCAKRRRARYCVPPVCIKNEKEKEARNSVPYGAGVKGALLHQPMPRRAQAVFEL